MARRQCPRISYIPWKSIRYDVLTIASHPLVKEGFSDNYPLLFKMRFLPQTRKSMVITSTIVHHLRALHTGSGCTGGANIGPLQRLDREDVVGMNSAFYK